MSSLCDRDWEVARLEKIKTSIEALEDALIAFAENDLLQTYRLDTGQTSQSVSRAEIGSLKNTLAFYYGQYDTWCNRLYGCGTRYVRMFR